MGSISTSYGYVQFFKNNLWWQIYPQIFNMTLTEASLGGGDNITWEEGNVLAPTYLQKQDLDVKQSQKCPCQRPDFRLFSTLKHNVSFRNFGEKNILYWKGDKIT
jgi:hypothetical protein